MKQINLISAIILFSFSPSAYCLSQAKIDTSQYKFDKSFTQQGFQFKFWKGSTHNTLYEVLLERVSKNSDTIIVMQPGLNGHYYISDKNGDGLKDFCTNYHGHAIIYLYNSSTHLFENDPVRLPEITGLVDSSRKIFWSLFEAQYTEKFNYSRLFKYNGNYTEDLYELKLISEEYADLKEVTKIELYKVVHNGENEELVFVRQIKTNSPGIFNYKSFWKQQYKALLGYR